jgi:hypothetical protein
VDFEVGEGVVDGVAEGIATGRGDTIVGIYEGFRSVFSCEAGAYAGVAGVEDDC